MDRQIKSKWLCCNWLCSFFEDFKTLYRIIYSQQELAELMEGQEPSLTQEYTDLFKGTNADIYIPLWASVCINPEGILLDNTTLEVVQFYCQWGYKPIIIDGNPPDFIGEQFRFLCYLYASALYNLNHEKPVDAIIDVSRSFIKLFLLDTVKSLASNIEKFSNNPFFHRVCNLMRCFVKNEVGVFDQYCIETWSADLIDSLHCHEAYSKGLNESFALEEPTSIKTSGRNNCGGKCSIDATVQGGCVLQLDTGVDIGQPQVRACVRGRGYRRTYLNGQRLRYPMKRIGERGEGKFRRISWDEAADIVAQQWARIRDQYGPASRYVNYGIGVSAVIRPDDLARRLLNLDGGYLSYYNSYSFACTRYVTPYIYGDIYSGNSIEDMLNTKLLILWGHNPAETVFGSQRNYYITKLKEQGVKIIVIDPRKSDSVLAYADEWIGIKPSTDSALADGMAYVIWSEGLHNQQFMDTYCIGFDEQHMPDGIPPDWSYHSYLFGRQDGIEKTPQWAETITGVPADTIIKLARLYASTKPACLLPGLGNQRIGNGEQTVRSMAMLTCMTGNVGIPGGGAAGANAVNEHPLPTFPTTQNPYPGSIPCFLWTKAIDDALSMNKKNDGLEGVERLETGIKMMINFAGNALINQHADINNSIKILKDTGKCEFIVCSDVFMTPSAKFADILLPAPSFLEDENIAPPWQYGHYLLYSNKVIEPIFGSKNEYDFLYMVAQRLGLAEEWSQNNKNYMGWLEYIYSDLRNKSPELPEFSDFQKKGGYTYQDPQPYIAYENQIKNPAQCKFNTPSGKIEIFSKRLYDMQDHDNIPAIPKYTPCPEGPDDELIKRYPLQLIGWHTKRRCHSIHDNNNWLEEVEPQKMWMNPADANKRGIKSNDIVEVFNDRGRIRIPVTVTSRVIKGVVAIPQGAWFTPGEDGIDTRGSLNVLTSTKPTPLAKGNAQHTNLVDVRQII